MKALVSLALVIAVCLCESKGLFEESRFVTEQSGDGLQELTMSFPNTNDGIFVVLYYSSRCPHCHNFAPYFELTAQKLSFESGVSFHGIDAMVWDNQAEFGRAGIRFFPAVKVIRTVKGSWTAESDDLETYPYTSFASRLCESLSDSNHKLSMNCSTLGSLMPIQYQNASADHSISSASASSILHDAKMAFIVSITTELFRGGDIELNPDVKEDLALMLKMCTQTFGLADELGQECLLLSDMVSGVSGSLPKKDWERMLNTTNYFEAIEPTYRSCKTYTCAVWRFFHLATLSSSTTLAPYEIMLGIRAFVDRLLSCAECRRHFLEHYDNCDFGRCDVQPRERLTSRDVTLWAWRFHNEVTTRVNGDDQNPAQWPTSADCPRCYIDGDRSASDEATFTYLKNYFTSDVNPLESTTKSVSSLATAWSLAIVVILGVFSHC